tara:strand:- start:2240 stop:2440 length:201 start_codon:yes stop_codon:yes gene_type:complete
MSLLFDVVKTAKGKSIEKVDSVTYNFRMTVCKSCPELLRTGNCAKCGCFVSDKTKYKAEQCPLKKW